jgi:hypothetical protein
VLLDRKLMVLFGAALIVIAGCGDDAGGGGKKKGGGGSGGAGGTEPVPPISAKANVKFKTKDRLLKDIGNALSLDANEICKEVGAFDCSVVHSIALGGVDAYGAGVYEPLKSSAVTTPVAVDRLVLGACQMRAHLDFKDMGNAVIYKGLDLQGGKLANVEDAAVAAAITTLYRRIHLRDPKDGEVTHLKELYNDVDAAGSAQPALDWATLGCYAVGTMMESVFY